MTGLTKKELKEVLKESLEPFAKAIQGDFVRLDAEVKEIKSDVKWMKDNFSELFAKLDEFISLYKKHEQELAALAVHIKRLEERLSRLENRQK